MNSTPDSAPAIVPPPAPGAGGGRPRWFSTKELLVALVLLFVVTPFVENFPDGQLIETGLATFVLVSALLAVDRRRRTLVAASVLLAPALLGRWLHHYDSGWLPPWLYMSATLLFVAFVVVNLLRFILLARRVDSEVLCAAICIYLMLGLLWASAYVLMGQLSPGAFAFTTATDSHHSMVGFTAFYFSFVTLSTVGYGDIVPVTDGARMLAMLEAMTGTLYLAILMARLVSLYSTEASAAGDDQPKSD